jgi:hypothetical protein
MENNSFEKSPFSKYHAGYMDGYEGNDIQMPSDRDYMDGYKEGYHDDSMGMPQKFTHTTKSKDDVISPAECRKV